ncbi:MAG: alkaline phosphatase [Bacteroidota bacterium]
MKYLLLLPVMLICCCGSLAQPQKYTVANAHSHNDYEQAMPFVAAYNAGFGSMEADIFLQDGNLYVAHNTDQLAAKKLLETYYLKPMALAIEKNGGFIYRDTSKRLQVLIDIKTEAISTLDAFIKLLQQYPSLANNRSINWVISGNRPGEKSFASYPAFILFDGVISTTYSTEALARIAMMSASFKTFSSWDGEGELPAIAFSNIQAALTQMHLLNKPVRLWAAPDNADTWKTLMQLGVDFINTDKISELAEFLRK